MQTPLQVTKLRSSLSLPDDAVKVACDAESLKNFMSYIVKRHDGAARRVVGLHAGLVSGSGLSGAAVIQGLILGMINGYLKGIA